MLRNRVFGNSRAQGWAPPDHLYAVRACQTPCHCCRTTGLRPHCPHGTGTKNSVRPPGCPAQLRSLTIHDLYESLIHDEPRNQMIVTDALLCLENGGCPLVLTERRAHLEDLVRRL